MSDLLADFPEATEWLDKTQAAYSSRDVYAKIATAVIWSDSKGTDGELLVPLDPEAYVANINANGSRLLNGHDPGFPTGRLLKAKVFKKPDGATFIAAILGFYGDETRLSFRNLGFDPPREVPSPSRLPEISEHFGIDLGADPREIPASWVEALVQSAPVPIQLTELSHNAAESLHELLILSVPYIALVWNPFTTAIATEAGKKVYQGIHEWFLAILTKLDELQNPIVEFQSHHRDCDVSFMFRGSDVKRNYAAHNARPAAAVQAAELVENLTRAGYAPRRLVYEFHRDEEVWFPSFAELHDGRLVTDNSTLIALEHMPSGLSVGMTRRVRPPTRKKATRSASSVAAKPHVHEGQAKATNMITVPEEGQALVLAPTLCRFCGEAAGEAPALKLVNIEQKNGKITTSGRIPMGSCPICAAALDEINRVVPLELKGLTCECGSDKFRFTLRSLKPNETNNPTEWSFELDVNCTSCTRRKFHEKILNFFRVKRIKVGVTGFDIELFQKKKS